MAAVIQRLYFEVKKRKIVYILSFIRVTKVGFIYFSSFIFVLILCVFIYLSHALSSALQIMLIFLVMYSFYDGITYLYVSLTTLFVGIAGILLIEEIDLE